MKTDKPFLHVTDTILVEAILNCEQKDYEDCEAHEHHFHLSMLLGSLHLNDKNEAMQKAESSIKMKCSTSPTVFTFEVHSKKQDSTIHLSIPKFEYKRVLEAALLNDEDDLTITLKQDEEKYALQSSDRDPFTCSQKVGFRI